MADVQKIYEGFATPGAHMEKSISMFVPLTIIIKNTMVVGEVAEQREIWLAIRFLMR